MSTRRATAPNNGMGAGGHFNPKGRAHGRHDAPEHHAGDLPNLSSDGEGVAMLAFTTEELTVSPGPELGGRPRRRHP